MPKKKKQIKEKPKIGRPTIFTPELGLEICKRIVSGKSLRKICKMKDMPDRTIIHRWLLDIDKKDFVHQYELACNVRTENMFDELEEIADLSERKESSRRSRLRIDTRKWYLSKIMPKKYGEKLDLTTGGEKIQTASDFLTLINAGATKVQGQGVESVPLGVLQDQKQAG